MSRFLVGLTLALAALAGANTAGAQQVNRIIVHGTNCHLLGQTYIPGTVITGRDGVKKICSLDGQWVNWAPSPSPRQIGNPNR